PRASRAAAARAAELPSPPAFPPSQRPTVPVVRVADAVSLPPGTSDRPLASAHHTRGTTCKHRSVAPALDTFLPHCSAEPLRRRDAHRYSDSQPLPAAPSHSGSTPHTPPRDNAHQRSPHSEESPTSTPLGIPGPSLAAPSTAQSAGSSPPSSPAPASCPPLRR